MHMKTKQHYIDLLNEVEAYRSLSSESFDFGTGLIINEMSYGSEDAYYEIDIQNLKNTIEFWDYLICKKYNKNKMRMNKHARKRKQIEKMKRLSEDNNWYPVYHNGVYLERYYRGGRSAHLKRQSSKIMRQYKGDFCPKGSKFKLVFDFWWELD